MVMRDGARPGVADHLGDLRRPEARVEQAGRRQVDREAARFLAGLAGDGLEAARLVEDRVDDEHVELDRALGVDGGGDDRGDRLGELRHLRPEHALVLVQLAGREVDDRLERDAVERAQAEEVVEHLGLHDLRGLRHPDAVGEARDLDRGRHGEEVPLRLGAARVDHDEAVLGVAGALGDLGDGLLG